MVVPSAPVYSRSFRAPPSSPSLAIHAWMRRASPRQRRNRSPQRRPSSWRRATTSASSATRSPSGCSTTAGSKRYLTRRFPNHELVFRNLGYSGDEIELRGQRSDGLRLARPVAGASRPDSAAAGHRGQDRGEPEPLREGRHQGRRDLRLLRLQRIVRRRGGPAEVQGRPRRRASSTRSAQKYNGKSAPRLVLFSPIAHRGLTGSPNLPDGERQQQAPGTLHRGDGRSGRRRTACGSSICSTPTQKLFATAKQAAHDQRRSPERRTATGRWRRSSTSSSVRPAGRERSATPSCVGSARARPCNDKNFYWYQPLSHDRRLLDLRRPGVSEIRRTARPTTRSCSASSKCSTS